MEEIKAEDETKATELLKDLSGRGIRFSCERIGGGWLFRVYKDQINEVINNASIVSSSVQEDGKDI